MMYYPICSFVTWKPPLSRHINSMYRIAEQRGEEISGYIVTLVGFAENELTGTVSHAHPLLQVQTHELTKSVIDSVMAAIDNNSFFTPFGV